jgi:hypothetical protein
MTGLVEFRQAPPEAAAAVAPVARLSLVADYLMWGLSARHDRLPARRQTPPADETDRCCGPSTTC